jgi:hypothetical protein
MLLQENMYSVRTVLTHLIAAKRYRSAVLGKHLVGALSARDQNLPTEPSSWHTGGVR